MTKRMKLTLFIYKWLPIFFHCHCRADRSFIIKNRKFPICARCTGELAGMLLSIITYIYIDMPNVLTCIILMLPLIADGVIQLLFTYESNNTKRFITGFLFGVAFYVLFIRSSMYCYHMGWIFAETLFA